MRRIHCWHVWRKRRRVRQIDTSPGGHQYQGPVCYRCKPERRVRRGLWSLR